MKGSYVTYTTCVVQGGVAEELSGYVGIVVNVMSTVSETVLLVCEIFPEDGRLVRVNLDTSDVFVMDEVPAVADLTLSKVVH